MAKTKNMNSRESTYKAILENIMQGKLKPGEVVTEIILSEQLGISRTPVREALKQLEIEGLIETEGRIKRVYYLSLHDIKEIFDLKIAIESDIARKAAQNTDNSLKEKLSDIIIEMNRLRELLSTDQEASCVLQKWLAIDEEFHSILFQLAGNQRAMQFIKRLNVQWHRIKFGIMAIEGRIEKAIIEHKAIGDAILNCDSPEAEAQMNMHLTRLKEFLMKLMKTFI